MRRFMLLAALITAVPAVAVASPVVSTGPNTQLTAQNLNGNFSSNNIATVTNSTTVPHVEISRPAGGGGFDWYSFSHNGGQVILDIDGPLTNFDTEVSIWDAAGNLEGNNDDNGADPGSNSGLNSFLQFANLPADTYFVAVSRFPSGQANGFSVNGPIGQGGAYNLNISANNVVPEPMSMVIFGGLAVAGIAGVRRRMKKA